MKTGFFKREIELRIAVRTAEIRLGFYYLQGGTTLNTAGSHYLLDLFSRVPALAAPPTPSPSARASIL